MVLWDGVGISYYTFSMLCADIGHRVGGYCIESKGAEIGEA